MNELVTEIAALRALLAAERARRKMAQAVQAERGAEGAESKPAALRQWPPLDSAALHAAPIRVNAS